MNATYTKVEELKLTQNVITSVQYDLGSDLLGFIGTISLLRPQNDYNATSMNLNIDIYDNPECKTPLNGNTPISNKNVQDQKYFLAFISNNNEYRWVDASDINIKNGFGEDSAKRPIVFQLGRWLQDHNIKTFTATTKYYIVYTWENIDSNGTIGSKSDINSIIWPNFENY